MQPWTNTARRMAAVGGAPPMLLTSMNNFYGMGNNGRRNDGVLWRAGA
ncbi:MAG: hypothetical protein R2932_38125 [Caldilineaceae bacterium]